MVELKGCLPNPAIGNSLRIVDNLLRGTSDISPRAARPAMRSERRQVRVRDRLTDADVAELVSQFMAGATRLALVERYGISLSSVKRVLRRYGAHR